MKPRVTAPMRYPLALSLVLIASAAIADPLPLARGMYVMRGTPCADPPFAALRDYDGRGLGDPHSRDCRARVLSRNGARYTIANDCIGVGSGPAPRDVERLSIAIQARTAFAVTSRYGSARYRLCPDRNLPPALRRRTGP